MRFINGSPPESRTLDPVAAGWTPLREPGKGYAVTVALVTSPFLLGAIAILLHNDSVWRPLFRAHPWALAGFVMGLLAMVPAHEFIHAVAYGCSLRSPKLLVVCWLRRGLVYVVYDEPLVRDRVLFMLAAPFLIMSGLPLCLLTFISAACLPLAGFFCLLHTGLCAGDFATFVRLYMQVPADALIHNQGWKTYWAVSHDADVA